MDEALSLCRNAKDLLYRDESAQIDDLTLSTLQIVLQRLDQCMLDPPLILITSYSTS